MDPREALILSLKREINTLQQENEHLKSALHLHSDRFADLNHERKEIPSALKVDLDRMTELEANEIIELVKLYIAENEALRAENSELFNTRDMILRDQEAVCRENERLLKKLEDVNSYVMITPYFILRNFIVCMYFSKWMCSTIGFAVVHPSHRLDWHFPLRCSTHPAMMSQIYGRIRWPMASARRI